MVPLAQWLVHRVVVPATPVQFRYGTPEENLPLKREVLFLADVSHIIG